MDNEFYYKNIRRKKYDIGIENLDYLLKREIDLIDSLQNSTDTQLCYLINYLLQKNKVKGKAKILRMVKRNSLTYNHYKRLGINVSTTNFLIEILLDIYDLIDNIDIENNRLLLPFLIK